MHIFLYGHTTQQTWTVSGGSGDQDVAEEVERGLAAIERI